MQLLQFVMCDSLKSTLNKVTKQYQFEMKQSSVFRSLLTRFSLFRSTFRVQILRFISSKSQFVQPLQGIRLRFSIKQFFRELPSERTLRDDHRVFN